jgi:hypothetical protein
MRAALPRLAVFVLTVWFQFAFCPGHSYTQHEGQIFVPQLERLDSPGLLSRDLVATHPNLTLTVFDEVAVFLHRTLHTDWPGALASQQVVSRTAGLVGIWLLAGACGLSGWWPLLVAVGAGFVGALPGIAIAPFSLEASPLSLAFGFVLLAAGLFAREKPLLTGFSGGLALIYNPFIAAVFWFVLLVAFLFDRTLRHFIRPTFTVLAVFLLLLANFAQLQPAGADTRGLFERLPPAIESVQRLRIPELWITNWQGRDLFFYLALSLVIAWSGARLWKTLAPSLRWLLLGLPAIGLLGIPLTELLLDLLHLRAGVLMKPAQTLLFTALPGAVICTLAARTCQRTERWLFLSAPLLVLVAAWSPTSAARRDSHTQSAADWARDNTWGASVFLFPDAGKDAAPGQFRAESNRAVWVDWQTGTLSDASDQFADEWHRRWKDTMLEGSSPAKIRRLLTLPIDYYVLNPQHALTGGKPVYSDRNWLIYDATDLRKLLKAE